jgi:putative AbiEii toxin of type IV toxin-antitoxin system/AAA ATPase-like protein
MEMPLALNSLQIRAFRGYRHLRVPRLGRVNLVVGKNNVGKSSFLEALWLYASQGAPSIVWQILEARDEGRAPRVGHFRYTPDSGAVVKNLFYGRPEFHGPPHETGHLGSIQIGPLDSPDKLLTIAAGWYTVHTDEEGGRQLKVFQVEEDYNTADHLVLALAIRLGKQSDMVYRLDRRPPTSPESERDRCVFVVANGMTAIEIGQLWDSISLTDLEEDVLRSLRIIAPEVERLNLISKPNSPRDRERIPMAKIGSLPDPIPLRSLGEGMNRLFGITLAMVNSKNRLLLLDEVESGLHYSVQPDVWRLIFETAKRLNVQVFATTHSMDCIEAFQRAAEENEEEGVLIRLENENGVVRATEFDERRLGIATREEIEVR